MSSEAAPYLCENGKIVHWVRHAEGVHSVESAKDHDALLSPTLFDAELSSQGWQQVNELRDHVRNSGLLKRIELVITSPLTRAMQTATGVFGDDGESNKLPFLAVELCRERLGVHPCGKRRNITEYKSVYPHIDFSKIECEDDVLWMPDHRETLEEIAVRGVKFMNWLKERPEKEIAVVTHSVFLKRVLDLFEEEPKTGQPNFLKNCELRSTILVDKSIPESDSPKEATFEAPMTLSGKNMKLITVESG